MTNILLTLVLVVLLAVVASAFYVNWTKSGTAVTQQQTIGQAKQAVLVQTRDLPDLKITSVGAIKCSTRSLTITLPARLGNFGEAAAVAADEDEGIVVCGEGAKYSVSGTSDKDLDLIFMPRPDSAGKPALTELAANTRSSVINFDAWASDFYSIVKVYDCPNVLRFNPTVDCRNDIEELNEDNNAIARVQCNKLFSSCATGTCSYECFYEASRNPIPATI